MTKEQYDLLDEFGVYRWTPKNLGDLDRLRKACSAAALIVPFADVRGMEEWVPYNEALNPNAVNLDALPTNKTEKEGEE